MTTCKELKDRLSAAIREGSHGATLPPPAEVMAVLMHCVMEAPEAMGDRALDEGLERDLREIGHRLDFLPGQASKLEKLGELLQERGNAREELPPHLVELRKKVEQANETLQALNKAQGELGELANKNRRLQASNREKQERLNRLREALSPDSHQLWTL